MVSAMPILSSVKRTLQPHGLRQLGAATTQPAKSGASGAVTPHQDYGFFGPDSVTWRVWGYPSSLGRDSSEPSWSRNWTPT